MKTHYTFQEILDRLREESILCGLVDGKIEICVDGQSNMEAVKLILLTEYGIDPRVIARQDDNFGLFVYSRMLEIELPIEYEVTTQTTYKATTKKIPSAFVGRYLDMINYQISSNPDYHHVTTIQETEQKTIVALSRQDGELIRTATVSPALKGIWKIEGSQERGKAIFNYYLGE